MQPIPPSLLPNVNSYFSKPEVEKVQSTEELVDFVARGRLYIHRLERKSELDPERVQKEITSTFSEVSNLMKSRVTLKKVAPIETPSSGITQFLLHLEDEHAPQVKLLEEWKSLPQSIRDTLCSVVANAKEMPLEEIEAFITENFSVLLTLLNEDGANPLEILIDKLRQQAACRQELEALKAAESSSDFEGKVFSSPRFSMLCHFVWYRDGGKENPHFGHLIYGEKRIRSNPRVLLEEAYLDQLIQEMEKVSLSDVKFAVRDESLPVREQSLLMDFFKAEDLPNLARFIDIFRVSNQEILLRLVYECLKIDALAIAKNIDKFGIASERERINIARKCIEMSHTDLAIVRNFDKFKIEDEETLMSIALKYVELEGGMGCQAVAENIIKFNKINESGRERIAYCILQKSYWGMQCAAENIDKFALSESRRAHLAHCMLDSGDVWGVKYIAENFDKLALSESRRARLAHCMLDLKGVWGVKYIAENFNKLAISNEEEKRHIILKCIEMEGGILDVAKNIDKLEVRDEEEKKRIIAKCFEMEGGDSVIAENIDKFELSDKEVLANIALKCIETEQGAAAVARNIDKFELSNKEILANIALECTKMLQNSLLVLAFVSNIGKFKIENEETLMDIALKCIKGEYGIEAVTKHIKEFGIKDENKLINIALKCAETEEGAKAVAKHIDKFVEITAIDWAIYFPKGSKILKLLNNDKHELLKDRENIHLKEKYAIHALIVLFFNFQKVREIPSSDNEVLDDLLLKTMKIRNEALQFKVFGALINFYNSAEFRNRFDTLMKGKQIAYAKLGMLLLVELSQDVEEELFQGSVKTFQDMMPHLRPAWKDKRTGIELLFLNTVFALLNSPMLPEAKWRFITRICSFVTEKEEWEIFRECLSIVELFDIYGYFSFSDAEEERQDWANFLTSEFSHEELVKLKKENVKNKLFTGRELNTEEVIIVGKRLIEILDSQRIPTAIEIYAQKIQNSGDEALIDAMQQFILSILTDRFLEVRYDPEGSPHLAKLAEEHNELWERWKSREMPVITDIEKMESASFTSRSISQEVLSLKWVRQKLIDDKHLDLESYPKLKRFLEDGTILDGEEMDAQMAKYCQALCREGISLKETVDVLKELKRVVSENPILKDSQWKRDIEDRLSLITRKKKKIPFKAEITDDWQDLFLCGTEVLGSCQTINGELILNKCLLAYCMDGKIQMATIKDERTGKILSRALIKLLFTEDGTPVLFLERIYPDFCFIEYQKLLEKLARKRAKQLGIELYSCNENLSLEKEVQTLQSLGTTVPFEYEDAKEAAGDVIGVSDGEYSILASRVL